MIQAFFELVRAQGGDPRPLVEEFGLHAVADGTADTPMPLSRLKALVDRAAELLNDPFLGVHLAQAAPRGLFGILEFCMRSAPTLGEAFQRMVRYVALLSDRVDLSVEGIAGSVVLELRVPDEPCSFGRHVNEFLLAGMIDQAPSVLGQPLRPERCWFQHADAASASELAAIFNTDQITFGAPSNGLSFAAAVLDQPLTTSDPALLSLLDQQATQSLARDAVFASFEAQVRSTLRRDLSSTGTVPSLASTASKLGISARTLQRKLAAEGCSFNDALGAAREELARFYVGDGKYTLSEIAFLLGYTELSPFTRAFKRWTGMTPTEFRARR